MPGAHVKDLFFDRQKVIDMMDRKSARALPRAGAFIRTRARSSMKRRKRPSKAGEAPSAHAGQVKDLLFFSYDPSSKSVVVGPTRFKRGKVPRVLEEGGKSEITTNKGRTLSVEIEARPFMGPALAAETAAGTIPSRWDATVST